MIYPTDWADFELIDAGEREKLERWGEYVLRRPDPQAIWGKSESARGKWESADLIYHRSDKGGGSWEIKNKKIKQSKVNNEIEITPWNINYKNLKFKIKPTGFKHTGLFPEQAVNWEYIIQKVQQFKNHTGATPQILNLFAYTGGATVAAVSAGAHVTHVDASKGINLWAKENVELLDPASTGARFLQDDVIKFVEREIRRGNKYDAIIMDPPVYGRGSGGQLWEIEKDLYPLIDRCKALLSPTPLFFLINAYANAFSPIALENILKTTLKSRFKSIQSGEVGLKATSTELVLPCGMFARAE